MWQTCALLIALATAAPDLALRPQPGEPQRAFHCRATHLPAARSCAARCDQPGAPDQRSGWECLHSCTQRSLHAMADCRAVPTDGPHGPLASR